MGMRRVAGQPTVAAGARRAWLCPVTRGSLLLLLLLLAACGPATAPASRTFPSAIPYAPPRGAPDCRRGQGVRGVMMDEESSDTLPAGRVDVFRYDDHRRVRHVQTDFDGHFAVELPTGRYILRGVYSDHYESKLAEVRVRPRECRALQLLMPKVPPPRTWTPDSPYCCVERLER
ncbi:MAG: hypothetical protein ACFCGT_21075 [Sandaracinaceae bacterium]